MASSFLNLPMFHESSLQIEKLEISQSFLKIGTAKFSKTVTEMGNICQKIYFENFEMKEIQFGEDEYWKTKYIKERGHYFEWYLDYEQVIMTL